MTFAYTLPPGFNLTPAWDYQDAAILRVRSFLAGEGMVCVKSRKRAFTALRESVARAQGYAPKVA